MAKKTETSEPTVESTAKNETGAAGAGTTDAVDSTSEPTVESIIPPVTNGSLKVKNTLLAGKILYGVTGKPIYFNEEGIAEPVAADYEHLLKVPGYEKA